MIDVKNTILHTLTNKFDRLRFLGDNDTKAFKKIIQLVVLDDLYDWAHYLNDSQAVQKKLQQLRLQFIQCNPEFEICRTPFDRHYVNVNTEQTKYTWKRVWDSQNLSEVDYEQISKITEPTKWTPDPTCSIQIVYFDGNGECPDIDVSTLTTCEKMNIYIDRETGIAWYLDTNCIWKQLGG